MYTIWENKILRQFTYTVSRMYQTLIDVTANKIHPRVGRRGGGAHSYFAKLPLITTKLITSGLLVDTEI